ncbi:MAG: HlyC/CorC family transporter, partial [Planctomycetes bacterium]|nr:HlyC/CorC family transporter [Planctomycetota bacterium]
MIALAYHSLIPCCVLIALLFASAFFSGSETAFFNLSRHQTRVFQTSSKRFHVLTADLLRRPALLLNCLLFGNMIVNVLYFAVSSTLIIQVKAQGYVTLSAVCAAASFFVLILVGEVVPKSLAYNNAHAICVWAALPAYVCVRLFSPFQSIINTCILEPFLRLVIGPSRHPKAVTTGQFKSLVEASRKQGAITADENRLLAEVVEMGLLKVRHIMTPRVDMVACSVKDTPETARQLMQRSHLTELPVFVHSMDEVVGMVRLRQLVLKPDVSLDRLVQKVHFVPEQKSVESLLQFFHRSHSGFSVVVDEYGGIAGAVRFRDIADQVLGQVDSEERVDAISQVGPFEYRLPGSYAVHDWADLFGIELSETQQSTLGG